MSEPRRLEPIQLKCKECKVVWTSAQTEIQCPACGSVQFDYVHVCYVVKSSNEANMIERPPYYIGCNGIESIDVIEGFELDFKIGNAVAYLLRAGKKGNADDHVRDLEKAQRYIGRRIKQLKGEKGW